MSPRIAGSLADQVRSHLLAGRDLDCATMAGKLAVRPDQVRHAVQNLRGQGMVVERIGTGLYRLADPGSNGRAQPIIAQPRPPRRQSGQTLDEAGRRSRSRMAAPPLGARVQITALALERGQIVIRLVGDDGTWSAVLRKQIEEDG